MGIIAQHLIVFDMDDLILTDDDGDTVKFLDKEDDKTILIKTSYDGCNCTREDAIRIVEHLREQFKL